MKITAIVPAAGSGSRYDKNKNKLLEPIKGIPVIVRTLQALSSVKEINEIIVCTSENIITDINKLIDEYQLGKVKSVILGGKTRQESVFLGLKQCKDTDLVLIHDGARPLITQEITNKAISNANTYGASIVAVRTKDTIKVVRNDLSVKSTLDRSHLWNIQTPQIFNYKALFDAHEKFSDEIMTDDSALIENNGGIVHITEGKYNNIKITTKEDVKLAELFLEG